jgi:hypothetical protein
MPLEIPHDDSTLLIRKDAFERAGLSRSAVDARLNLAADEFRVEGDLIVIGPLPAYGWLGEFIAELETLGLAYSDDFFELSWNWPTWLTLFAMATRGERAR